MVSISVKAEDDLRGEHSGASRPLGVTRSCMMYAGELARDRVVTPDGQDYVVTTTVDVRKGSGFLTGAYPVSRGYLVMMRQPLVESQCTTEDEARACHAQLASVLAQAGSRVVRARAALQARKASETREARAARASQLLQDEPLASSPTLDLAREAVVSLS
jgi:hypothetical protein